MSQASPPQLLAVTAQQPRITRQVTCKPYTLHKTFPWMCTCDSESEQHMDRQTVSPQVYRIKQGQAKTVRQSPYGSVGTLFQGEGVEVVWVRKQQEAMDPGWFCQDGVDVLVVLEGQLRVEYADPDFPPVLLQPGDALLLPAQTACRAYRWPRETEQATVFLAVSPQHAAQVHH